MSINRAALKAEARNCMRASKASPYLMALLYVLASILISRLMSNLLFPSDMIHYVLNFETGEIGLYISPDYYSRVLREPLAYLISLLLELSETMLGVGAVLFCLRAARRAANSYWNLVDGFAAFFRVLWLYILESVFTFLWSLLFVIPGIVASYRYRLAIYLLLENPGMSALDCIRESKRLMAGRKWELFVLDLSFIGWLLLSLIPFAEVFVMPYIETTRACYYLAVLEYDSRGAGDGGPGGWYGREDGYRDRRDPWDGE